jgi:hypothetical protein
MEIFQEWEDPWDCRDPMGPCGRGSSALVFAEVRARPKQSRALCHLGDALRHRDGCTFLLFFRSRRDAQLRPASNVKLEKEAGDPFHLVRVPEIQADAQF